SLENLHQGPIRSRGEHVLRLLSGLKEYRHDQLAPDNPSPPSRHVTPRLASPIPFVGRAANRRARAGVLLD
ncbi:hypothetical protein ACGFR8_37405, partial [Streptomyces brevispora]|uniref:hypothetical protein n=1 Tax=Streptomyces brevispora TaxID=887462 RepID=UPI00371D6238